MAITPAVSDLFVAIYRRRLEGKFHRAFVVCTNPETSVFTGFQARCSGVLWEYKKTEDLRVFASRNLIALIRIGNLAAANKTVGELDALLAEIPLATPKGDGGRSVPFDSLIWIRQAARLLHEHTFLVCPDVMALETECETTADILEEAFTDGDASYTIRAAKKSTSVA